MGRHGQSGKHIVAMVLGLIVVGAGTGPSRAARPFYVDEIPAPAGGSGPVATVVSPTGLVAGKFYAQGQTRAFVWDGSTSTDLGTLGGSYVEVNGMNGAGLMVGYGPDASGANRGFRWQGGDLEPMGTLGGYGSYAKAVNASGQVVGYAQPAGSSYLHGFLDDGSGLVDLHPIYFANYAQSVINDISIDGDLAGIVRDAQAKLTPMAVIDGQLVLLDKLSDKDAWPLAMNDAGQSAGYATLSNYDTHAARWDPNGKVHDLGTLGGSYSKAEDISNAGQVVGMADLSNVAQPGNRRAFLHDGTEMIDLNDRLADGGDWLLSTAWSINDAGQIAAYGTRDGSQGSCRLTPALLGDANADRVVDVGDLGILAGHWQATGADWAQADFNGDGLVDVGDLGILAGHWQASSVPEPVSLAVVLAVGLLGGRTRRR